jgi:hypothetical protein
MSTIAIYFQYTHLSNKELNVLRNEVSMLQGCVRLISSKQLIGYDIPVSFGKLLMITMNNAVFNLELVRILLIKFKMLRLVFIQLNSFILSPDLYELYNTHFLRSSIYFNRLCISTSMSSIRVLLFKHRYYLLSLLILFQETLLYKSNTQYIC